MVQPGDVVVVQGLEGAWVVVEEVSSPLPHMKHWRIRQPTRKKVVSDDMILSILPPMQLEVGQKVKVPGFTGAVVTDISDGEVRIQSTRIFQVPGTGGIALPANATLSIAFITLANDPRVGD